MKRRLPLQVALLVLSIAVLLAFVSAALEPLRRQQHMRESFCSHRVGFASAALHLYTNRAKLAEERLIGPTIFKPIEILDILSDLPHEVEITEIQILHNHIIFRTSVRGGIVVTVSNGRPSEVTVESVKWVSGE